MSVIDHDVVDHPAFDQWSDRGKHGCEHRRAEGQGDVAPVPEDMPRQPAQPALLGRRLAG